MSLTDSMLPVIVWVCMQVKGFEKDKLAVTTLLFEGDKATVDDQQAKVFAITAKHGGLMAGEGT